MADFVSKEEFENFKDETNKKFECLNKDIKGVSGLLTKIDKKTDILINNVENNKANEVLKIENAIAPCMQEQKIQKQEIKENSKSIEKIQENNRWVWRTIAGVVITAVGGIIVSAL